MTIMILISKKTPKKQQKTRILKFNTTVNLSGLLRPVHGLNL